MDIFPSLVRSTLERQIAGALRSTIDAHGPITPQQIGSAAKRIAAQVIAESTRLKEVA